MSNTLLSFILSSTVICGIISSLVVWLSNKRNDFIENVTKERKVWREEIRRISKDILNANSKHEVIISLEELKLRINANGICTNHILDDSYLWEYMNVMKIKEDNDLKERGKLTSLISCLLKYDWERSKEEVSGNKQLKLLIISLTISFIYFSIIYFLRIDPSNLKGKEVYMNYCVIFTTSTVIYIYILNFANLWRNQSAAFFNHITFIIIATVHLILFYIFIIDQTTEIYVWRSLNAMIDLIIILNPILAMTYAYTTKTIRYRNNVGRLLLSVMIIQHIDTIPTKFECFVNKRIRSNLNAYLKKDLLFCSNSDEGTDI